MCFLHYLYSISTAVDMFGFWGVRLCHAATDLKIRKFDHNLILFLTQIIPPQDLLLHVWVF